MVQTQIFIFESTADRGLILTWICVILRAQKHNMLSWILSMIQSFSLKAEKKFSDDLFNHAVRAFGD